MGEKDTEALIKETAREIFQQRGFAATKTRDIAEEAGINLALLNYYFRSKKKLFDIIMLETVQQLFSGLLPIVNNESTTFREKIELIVSHYIDMLTKNPDMATFIINEIKLNPEEFAERVGFLQQMKQSVFVRQFAEAFAKGEIPAIHPLHFLMNVTGLIVFPFVSSPMIKAISGLSESEVFAVIEERKRLIPLWIDSMLKVV